MNKAVAIDKQSPQVVAGKFLTRERPQVAMSLGAAPSPSGRGRAHPITKEQLAAAAGGGPGPHARTARARLRRGPAAAVLAAAVAARLGPRPHRPLRGAVALRQLAAPSPLYPRATTSTTPSRTRASARPGSRCSTRRWLAPTSPTSASGRSTCSTESSSTRRPAAPRRLCVRARRPARAPARRDDAADAPALRAPLRGGGPAAPGPRPGARRGGVVRDRHRGEPWAYDNELPAHELELAPFQIATAPVTNARFLAFVETAAEPPLSWLRDAAAARPLRRVEGSAGRARLHVSWFQAERSPAGRVSGCPPSTSGRRLPRPACSTASARSGSGRRRLHAYPGFERVPVPRVLRGLLRRRLPGAARRSCATDPTLLRPSFRNWDYPQRRQIFSGLRLAR